MGVARYKKPPPARPVGILLEDARILGEGGELWDDLGRVPREVKVYGDKGMAVALCGREIGSVIVWDQNPIRFEHRTREAILLEGFPFEDQPGRVLDGLCECRDWLHRYGAGITSMGGSSFSLVRATVERPFRTQPGPSFPPVQRVIGGRIEMFKERGHYPAFEAWDVSAAYANEIGRITYGRQWLKWPLDGWREFPNCFVRARVHVPPDVIPPLPERDSDSLPSWYRMVMPTVYPVGDFEGIWAREEIMLAENVGCTVTPLEVWVNSRTDWLPFGPWHEAIMEGRRMKDVAGHLAKLIGNALWGMFALNQGQRFRITYVEGHRIEEPLPKVKYQQTQDPAIAELVTARTRVKLYDELIAVAGDKLIAVHTDGGLTEPGVIPKGERWRKKGKGTALEIHTPQHYTFFDDRGIRRYVMSGAHSASDVENMLAARRRITGFLALRDYMQHLKEERRRNIPLPTLRDMARMELRSHFPNLPSQIVEDIVNSFLGPLTAHELRRWLSAPDDDQAYSGPVSR